MRKLMSIIVSILFVLSLTGPCFAQSTAPTAADLEKAAAEKKTDVKKAAADEKAAAKKKAEEALTPTAPAKK